MIDLETKLTQIEKKLQLLIEGSSTKLFNSKDRYLILNQKLIASLKDSIMREADGEYFAPDNFLIKVNPDQLNGWLADQKTLDLTAHQIMQYAQEEGIHFKSTPLIEVDTDPDIEPGDMQVELRFREDNITKTTAISIDEEQLENEIPSDAYLIVNGTEIFSCDKQTIKIGRSPENQLIINDQRISRQHAQIRAVKGNFVIFDLNSSGGTFVNGERINKQVLHPGDVISLAGVPLIYGQEKPAQENTQHMTIDF